MTTPNVRVGAGVFILQSSKSSQNPLFLFGKRKGSHGAGTWALPGGHLEFGESIEECAAREVLEETGLKIKNVRFLTATDDYMKAEGKHYITMFMVGIREDESVEAQALEPHKCEGWEWYEWKNLVELVERPQSEGRELFLPMINLIKQRPDIVPKLR